MNTCESLVYIRAAIDAQKQLGRSVAFVPTMGALHAGHLSLVDLAKEMADYVVVSIFVNPTQFAPHEDFDTYPREHASDLAQCKAKGVDMVYMPLVAEIYPKGSILDIATDSAAEGLESASRPHFFHGVVNVVARLFAHVTPDIAIFGEKDFQQLMVIRQMVAAQNLPIKIIAGATKRDEKGLALSSRNAYLSAEELHLARRLNVILNQAAAPAEIEKQLLDAGFDKVDYVAERWGRKLAAVWVGRTRLIDNVPAKTITSLDAGRQAQNCTT